MKIKSNLTRQEAAQQIVSLVEWFFCGRKLDMTIGFNSAGDVVGKLDAHGTQDIIMPIYSTGEGWISEKYGNPFNPDYWEKHRDSFVSTFEQLAGMTCGDLIDFEIKNDDEMT